MFENVVGRMVEFFGLPGAGKTTLAERFSRERSLPLIIIRGGLERCFFALLFVFRHPFRFRFLYSVIRNQTRSGKTLFLHKRRLFFTALAKEAKARWSRGGAVVDDGLLQFLLALYEREIADEEARALLCHFDRGRTVIMVEAFESARLLRMKERGRIPRLFLGEDYVKKWFSVLEYNYQMLKRVIAAKWDFAAITN